MTPVTRHAVWGSWELEPELEGLRWLKRRVSVLCAATMPPGTTMGCGPVRAARPSSREAFRVGRRPTMTLSSLNHAFFIASVIENNMKEHVGAQLWTS